MPAARAVTEAAVCLAVNHVNLIATYHYDIKKIAVQQESGQQLEVLHAGEVASHCHSSLGLLVRLASSAPRSPYDDQ